MDDVKDFNAKKARAHKLKQDKYRDRHKKLSHSGNSGAKGDSKDVKHSEMDPGKRTLEVENSTQNQDSGDKAIEPLFPKRKLVSNWERYEESPIFRDYEDPSDLSGAQFELLASTPVSAGGHLKLKHEEEWDKERAELQMPWFQLDIKNVENNLSTIPFYQRLGLPQDIFSEMQMQRMTSRAKKNAASLNDVLKIQNLSLLSDAVDDYKTENISVRAESSDVDMKKSSNKEGLLEIPNNLPQSSTSCAAPIKSEEDDILDEILALAENSSSSSSLKSAEVASESKGNDALAEADNSFVQVSPKPLKESNVTSSATLDDWLDSILDD